LDRQPEPSVAGVSHDVSEQAEGAVAEGDAGHRTAARRPSLVRGDHAGRRRARPLHGKRGAVSRSRDLRRLHASTGAIHWAHAAPPEGRVGFGDKSLALFEDRAYTVYDLPDRSGRLFAVDARTGRGIWTAIVPAFSVAYAGPLVVTRARLYVDTGEVRVFDARTGADIGSIGSL
jgi:outer membrane protein assembly factor BamB